jgi:hypothetical protein
LERRRSAQQSGRLLQLGPLVWGSASRRPSSCAKFAFDAGVDQRSSRRAVVVGKKSHSSGARSLPN